MQELAPESTCLVALTSARTSGDKEQGLLPKEHSLGVIRQAYSQQPQEAEQAKYIKEVWVLAVGRG